MSSRVYIETTVVSYLTARAMRDVIQLARQAATEQWWREQGPKSELYVSELVVVEAAQGDAEASKRRLDVLAAISRLPITDEVVVLAKRLMSAHALPTNAEDDALHVSLAAVHGMDVLLTWNCRHIANVIAMPKIRATIEQAGYDSPTITTPEDLLASMGERS